MFTRRFRRQLAPASATLLLALGLAPASPTAFADDADPLFEEPAPVDRGQVIQDLIGLGLSSEDPAVRAWALRAAGALGGTQWRQAITDELENAQATIRISAAVALLDLNHRGRDAQALLVRELAEGDAQTRAFLLDRILPLQSDALRAAVLRDAVRQMEDETALRQTLSSVARRGTASDHAVLDAGAALTDDDRRAWYVDPVRRAARPEGISLATALIAHRDAPRQQDGLRILQAIGTPDARQAALPLLNSANAPVAQAAGLYLARFGNADALTLVRDLALNAEQEEDLRMEAFAIVRDVAPQLFGFAQLQSALEQGPVSNRLRARIHECIGATRDPDAIAWLEQKLDGDFADERMDALSGIGFSGRSDHVETLRQIVASQGAVGIRSRAARGLGHLGGDEAAAILIGALRTERDPQVKVQIVRALGDSGSADAAQPILYEFARGDDDITEAGLDALRALGNTAIAPQLVPVARTYRSAPMRWKASVVLTHLDPEAGTPLLLAQLDRPPAGFERDLAELPDALREAVDARLLRHANPEIAEAALARVRGRADGGLSLLRPLAVDAPTAEVRRVAIHTVTSARMAEDAPIFQELTRNRDRQVRLQAWAALAELRQTDHEALLADQLNTTDVAVRLIAAYGLIRMGRAA